MEVFVADNKFLTTEEVSERFAVRSPLARSGIGDQEWER
jgi:hypothetical protein